MTRTASTRRSLLPGRDAVRLISMIGALIFMGMTIVYLRNMSLSAQQIERMEGPKKPALAGKDLAAAQAAWQETVIAGPNDEDPVEQEDVKPLFEAVTDRQPMLAADSPAYWRLMKWARSSTFADLQKRSRRDVPFVKLWQEPEKHRGELIQLRLHVLRILSWEAPENSAGVKTTYEIWGWTNDSRNPYVVNVAELPPGLSEGASVQGEVLFQGYFLKLFAYDAFNDVHRGAPLLVGRVKSVAPTSPPPVLPKAWGRLPWQILAGGGALLALMLASLFWKLRSGRRTVSSASVDAEAKVNVEEWLEAGPAPRSEPGAIPDFVSEAGASDRSSS
jgi:hypothetical protein